MRFECVFFTLSDLLRTFVVIGRQLDANAASE